MLLSLKWLKDFVNIPTSITPEELGLKLTLHTVEIDGVEKQSKKFNNVVVGKILELKKHPQADRLQLVKVDVGKEKLDIVCGAHNIEVGNFVPVALVGAILPNGIEIKEAEIRGVKSFGMLCAEDELGLGHDHSGILILTKGKLGQCLAENLKLDDTIFEVDNKSITNRPDLWGHFGMARDIAAFLDIKLIESKLDLQKLIKLDKTKDKIKLSAEVKDEKLCPRYMAIAMKGIKIAGSPQWMKERLSAVGMRPINNIVDITNYVMLELGQPLHAFDASLVKEIVVRRAGDKEMMETLDGQKRELTKEMLVIADKERAIAIAGVMGGASSEISDKTESIIIEAANFEPVQIRKTSQKLGLRTESSIRFEKSLDPNFCEQAIARVIELVKEVCPESSVASELVDIKSFKINDEPIVLDIDWLNKVIGEEIGEKRIIKTLNNLGFKTSQKKNEITVNVPTWRATKDISIREDLMEEIVRIYGYNNLKPSMPKVTMEAPRVNEERKLERKIKNILAEGAKLSEVYNYSFVGEDQLRKLKMEEKNHIRLANPIISQHSLLRQSLVPGLLENIKLNQSRYEKIGIFEIGSIFSDLTGEINKDSDSNEKLPFQEKHLGVVVAGGEDVFGRLKGIIEYLFNYFDLDIKFETTEDAPAWADKNATAELAAGGKGKKNFGLVFVVDSQIASSFGVKKETAIAEIDLRELIELILSQPGKIFKKIQKYPSVMRDLAFVVESKVMYNDIKKEIENSSPLIKEIELFDVYQGEELGKDKKSLAFHIIYQSEERTLTAEEVEKEQEKLTKTLEKKFSAQIRNF